MRTDISGHDGVSRSHRRVNPSISRILILFGLLVVGSTIVNLPATASAANTPDPDCRITVTYMPDPAQSPMLRQAKPALTNHSFGCENGAYVGVRPLGEPINGGHIILGPNQGYETTDPSGGDRFTVQLTKIAGSPPGQGKLAFGYIFSAMHRAQATSQVTPYLLWSDNKTKACRYADIHPISYTFHWSCATMQGASGGLNGTMKYTIPGYQAIVTFSFRIGMLSWA